MLQLPISILLRSLETAIEPVTFGGGKGERPARSYIATSWGSGDKQNKGPEHEDKPRSVNRTKSEERGVYRRSFECEGGREGVSRLE